MEGLYTMPDTQVTIYEEIPLGDELHIIVSWSEVESDGQNNEEQD